MAAALGHVDAPVLKLPTSAFLRDGSSSAVWVLDSASMTVRMQPVVVAGADGNEVMVASGVAPGVTIVTAGVHALTPGQKVKLYEGDASAALAPQAAASVASR